MNEIGIIKHDVLKHATIGPTRQCLVCERLENPRSDIVDTGKAYLCPRCKAALRKVVESENIDECN